MNKKNKIVRIYDPITEVAVAFLEMEKLKKEGYSGVLSFVRGKTADVKVKIIYTKQ